jgi:hypothetical protein
VDVRLLSLSSRYTSKRNLTSDDSNRNTEPVTSSADTETDARKLELVNEDAVVVKPVVLPSGSRLPIVEDEEKERVDLVTEEEVVVKPVVSKSGSAQRRESLARVLPKGRVSQMASLFADKIREEEPPAAKVQVSTDDVDVIVHEDVGKEKGGDMEKEKDTDEDEGVVE